MGGEDRAFLPAYEVREIVSGEEGAALGLLELGVGRVAGGHVVVGEAAERVRDF